MTTTAQQFESMKRAMRAQDCRKSEGQKIRTVNITKWKSFMLKTLESMLTSQQYDGKMVEELRNFVKNISEEKYIEAIINMQPYKPKFILCSEILATGKQDKTSSKMHNFQTSPRKELSDQMTTTSGSLLNRTEIGQIVMAARNKRKEQLMSMFIEDQLLSKEISQPNHPYAKILQAFIVILENKYKAMIERNKCKEKVLTLDEITNQLSMDFKFLENFFKITSVPILDILNLTDPAQRIKFSEDLQHFMVNYLRNNQKICLSLRKILRFYLKSSQQLAEFQLNCPLNADIQLFGLPKPFQIEGCYIYATSQLISFIDITKGKDSLAKLSTIRQAIYKDLDQYYKSSKGEKEALEVNSEVQLQILKFSLVKLRIFAGEILPQLKLLQVLYGSDEMAYHFDEASYIHSQMSIAFEAIQNNL